MIDSSPDARLVQDDLVREVRWLLEMLSPVEAYVLRNRFGVDGGEELSLQAIGNRYGRSVERMRQIECQALRKLHRYYRNLENDE